MLHIDKTEENEDRYRKAVEALENYKGEDPEERARLEAAVEEAAEIRRYFVGRVEPGSAGSDD